MGTVEYAHVEAVLDDFFEDYLQDSDHTFAFVSADQQGWIQMWYLKTRMPQKYTWLIPIPGEWHTEWHLLKAIYRMYGKYLLLPLSQYLNYKTLDLEAGVFHYAEDFFMMVTICVLEWMKKCVTFKKGMTATEWLKTLHPNENAYELAYACIYYFIPYWIFRGVVKYNIHDEVEDIWRHFIHLFIATNKHHYALLFIRFLWILKSINPDIRKIYNQFRVFSFSGKPGTGVAIDLLNELVCVCE